MEPTSTTRCPFAQRLIMTLKHKGIVHRLTFIDTGRLTLNKMPELFRQLMSSQDAFGQTLLSSAA